MKVLGKTLTEGRLVRRLDGGRVEAEVSKTADGYTVKGTVSGRPGRLEVFRTPAPPLFLLNNWQSWGPMQAAAPSTVFPELEAKVRDYSPWLFSPVPDVLLAGPESDYFTAWDGGLAGFQTSRIGHPYFTIEGDDLVGFVDYFGAEFPEPIPLEPLAVLTGRTVGDLLDSYGSAVKRTNRVRINPWNPVGWCSWYHYFGKLGWSDVLENLDAAAADRVNLPFDVFQVDDGFETAIGDWLSPKADYPDINGLARAIKARKFQAGIWTAPFSAAESSELFARHPEWFVAEGGRPKPCYRGWGERIFALDPTHPGAAAWLHDTFTGLVKAGFTYLKIDFLFAAAMAGERFRPVTPVQAYREGLKIIKKAAGGNFVLGCGAPLLPSVGLVDGMRIGEDTAPFWKNKPSAFMGPNAYYALRNALFRQFMHGKFWLNDPDCLLLRDRQIELTVNERELYALVSGALDNMILDSDRLALLGTRAKDLFKRTLALRGGRVRVEGLLGELGDDAFVIESNGGPQGPFKLAVNMSDASTSIKGRKVGPRSAALI